MTDLNEQKHFARNMRMFVLWLIPVAYLAIIAAVTAHEVIGHGFTASILGSRFEGFGIRADGMGWATIDPTGLSTPSLAIMFAGGAFVTNLLCVVFILLGIRFRKSYLTSSAFFVFAYAFLSDGIPYFFWDSIFGGIIGDPSAILRLYPYEWLRVLFIITSGLIMVVGIFIFNYWMLTRTVAWFKTSGEARVKEILIIAGTLFTMQALGWFSFDWQQLIPIEGIGFLPPVTAILLTALFLGIIAIRMRKYEAKIQTGVISWKVATIVSWCACIALVAVIIIWLQHGVELV